MLTRELCSDEFAVTKIIVEVERFIVPLKNHPVGAVVEASPRSFIANFDLLFEKGKSVVSRDTETSASLKLRGRWRRH